MGMSRPGKETAWYSDLIAFSWAVLRAGVPEMKYECLVISTFSVDALFLDINLKLLVKNPESKV